MKIERMAKGDWGKIVAFFDLTTDDGFTIKGFKLVEGTNGKFVGFPSQKNNDGEYHDTVWAEKEVKAMVTDIALKEYESSTEQEQELPVMPTEDLPF